MWSCTAIYLNSSSPMKDLIVFVNHTTVCTTEEGSRQVPKELCSKPIDADTPLSVLLPTNKEAGLCSYAMLDLLYRRQNNFLENYVTLSNR